MTLRRLLQGSALSTIDQIVRAISALALTPVMVSALGMADFGLWVLLTGLFSQFVLLDPGLQSSLPRFLVQRDAGELRAVASTAQRIYGIVAAASAMVALTVWLLLPLFINGAARLETARWIAVLLGITTVTSTLMRLPALYLESLMRRDLIAGIAIVRVVVCTTAALWLLLRRGGGLLDVALVHASGALVESLLLAWCGRELFSSISRRWVDRAVARRLLGFSSWAYLISTCERLRSGLDGFVLGWLRGSPAAGAYNLGARPVSMVFDTVYACIGTQLLPAFTRLRETGDHARLGSAFVSVTRLAAYLSITAAGFVVALGPSFLLWWVPAQAAEAAPVLLCLVLPLALQMAQVPAVHLLYAVAEHRVLALAQTAGLVLNLVLSIALARWLGIVGAALGTAIEIMVLHGLVMPMIIACKMRITPAAFLWRAQWMPLLACAAAIAVPAALIAKWMPPQPSVWNLITAAIALLAWLAVWARAFRVGGKEFSELRQLLK